MARKIIIFCLLVVLLVSGFFIFLLFQKNDDVYEPAYARLSSNVSFPWQNNNSIYYFTGSSFAKYNLTDYSTERLSDYLYIKNDISSVSWTEESAIFFATTSNKDDDITKALIDLGADTSIGRWWRYDFTNKQLQLLAFDDGSCTEMIEQDKVIFCIQPLDGSKTKTIIKKYSILDGGSKVLTESDDTISKLSVSGNSLQYIVTSLSKKDSLRSLQLSDSSNDSHIIYSSDGAIDSYASNNNLSLVLESPVHKKNKGGYDNDHESILDIEMEQNLKLIDNREGKQVDNKKIKGLAGSIISVNDRPVFFSQSGLIMNITDSKIHHVEKTTPMEFNSAKIFYKQGEDLILVDDKGNLLIDTKSEVSSKLKGSDLFTNNPSESVVDFYVDNTMDGESSVYLYNTNLTFPSLADAVDSYLLERSYDANLFKFNWLINSTGNPVPLNPNISSLN